MFRFWLMWLALQTGHDWNELANDAAIAMDFPELQTTGSNSEGPSENSIEGQTCPELGTQLEYFDPTLFHHITRTPQCGHEIKPKLTLFTRTETHGCILTENPNSGTPYNIPLQCHSAITGLKKIVFIVHGFAFFPDQLDEFLNMKTEILKLEDVGVIVVDWYTGARLDVSLLKGAALSTIMADFVNLDFYHQAAANTRYIGAALAHVAENLRKLFVEPSSKPFMHCIGHSLGSHVCGFFGKALKKISAAPLDRITGLDPAGPLFLESGITVSMDLPSYSDDSHLCAADARLVDTVHTDSTWLGSFTKTGDLDFYVGESKTNEDTKKVDKFGYDQPGVEDCFMESHHRAIDIFAATIQDNTCIAEQLCTSIHLNATNGCQPQENIQFGYNIEHGQSLIGSVPIYSDTGSIKCSQGTTINVHSHPKTDLLKEVAKIDFCSLFRSIQEPIRELLQTIDYLHKESVKRVARAKKAVRLELDRLLNSPEAASASAEVIVILKDMQELEILQAREINKLNALARRTQRVSGDMVSDIKEIMAHGTGNVDIEDIVIEVRELLNYSNGQLDIAEKTLEEMERKWGDINAELTRLSNKIEAEKNNAVQYQTVLNNQASQTKAGKGTVGDWFKGIGSALALVVSIVGTMGMATRDTGNIGGTDNIDNIGNIGNTGDTDMGGVPSPGVGKVLAGLGLLGVVGISSEINERWEENETIETFEEAVQEVEKVINHFKAFSEDIATAKARVKDKKEEIIARNKILNVWKEVVGNIITTYGRDDYKKLENYMLNRNTYKLKRVLKKFEELENVAKKFLNVSDP